MSGNNVENKRCISSVWYDVLFASRRRNLVVPCGKGKKGLLNKIVKKL